MELVEQIQTGNTNQLLPYHTHNGGDSPKITVDEASFNLSDITTGDATTSRHGLLPKLSGTATEFLDGTGDYDTVKDSDLSTSDITTNNFTTSKHGFVPKGTNTSTKFLRDDGGWATPQVSVIEITVNAGETLAVGEVVRLYTASGSYSSDGYGMANGTIYAVRAAANDTTYGPHVLGVMTTTASYLSTGTCALAGNPTGLSGLTANTKYYLDNYSGASSETISQTAQDSEQNLTSGVTLVQYFQPTSSRLDKIIVKARKNGGGASTLSASLKRGNTLLETITLDLGANSATLAEKTLDFTDRRVYKGEILSLNLSADTDFAYVGYQASTNPYAPTYAPDGGSSVFALTGGSVPASSDLYMKIYEYTNFGILATSAGTRKYKIGHSLSTTSMTVQLQEGDSIL